MADPVTRRSLANVESDAGAIAELHQRPGGLSAGAPGRRGRHLTHLLLRERAEPPALTAGVCRQNRPGRRYRCGVWRHTAHAVFRSEPADVRGGIPCQCLFREQAEYTDRAGGALGSTRTEPARTVVASSAFASPAPCCHLAGMCDHCRRAGSRLRVAADRGPGSAVSSERPDSADGRDAHCQRTPACHDQSLSQPATGRDDQNASAIPA